MSKRYHINITLEAVEDLCNIQRYIVCVLKEKQTDG